MYVTSYLHIIVEIVQLAVPLRSGMSPASHARGHGLDSRTIIFFFSEILLFTKTHKIIIKL